MNNKTKLNAHIPKYLAKRLNNNLLCDLIANPIVAKGTFVFMDISGFTNLSENLSKFGREGTEVLTFQISNYFEKALENVFKFGGDVIKFGGDALTIFFEKNDKENDKECVLRSLSSCKEVMETLCGYEAKTAFGTFPLQLKIGVSFGESKFLVLGDPEARCEYIFSGKPLDLSAEAEHHANPSDIVIDEETFKIAEKDANYEKIDDNFYKLNTIKKKIVQTSQSFSLEVNDKVIEHFLIPSVYRQIEVGGEKLLSEHRPVIPCFVSFPSLNLNYEKDCSTLQNYFLKITEVLRGFGGSFNRMDTGDKGSKFLCFFGAPETYADNEERAVAFSLELKKLEKEIPQVKGQSIGITSGIAYCGLVGSQERQEYTIMGDVVNVSARLMTSAKGRIFASNEVREKTRKKFQYSSKIKLSLKGKSFEIVASTPIKPLARTSAFSDKKEDIFVGRKEETRKIVNLIKRSPREIVISGEAGMGKSDFIRHLTSLKELKNYDFYYIYLPVASSEPFFISKKMLNLLFQHTKTGSFQKEYLQQFIPEKKDFFPLFNLIIGEKVEESDAIKSLSLEQRMETLSELFSQLTEKVAENLKKKIVFVLEDFDRISKEEKDFILKVFERLSFKNYKFLLLSRDKKPLCEKSKTIELKGLAKEDIANFLEKSLKSSNFSQDLVDFLCERSSGNPFYLKEIISILKEKDIVKVNKDNFVIFNPEKAFFLSRSLEDILLMRIDTLNSIDKNLLKVASCFGETFEVDKLSQVFVPRMVENEIRERFLQMEHLGIEKISEKEFKFSNKILRETAYNSILVSNKRNIHKQIGEIFEKEEENEGVSETLSFHFGLGEEFQKAFLYSLVTARKSFSEQQFYKAQKFYSLSLEYGEKIEKSIDEKELLDYLKTLITTGEYEKAEIIIEKLIKSDDEEIVFKAKLLWISMLDQRGEYQKEYDESIKLIKIAENKNNGEIVVLTIKYAISALIRLGKYDDALRLTEEGYNKIFKYNKEEELPNFYILSGSANFYKGNWKRAKEYYETSLTYSKEIKSYEVMLRSYFGILNCKLALQEYEEAASFAEELLKISNNIGSRLNILASVISQMRIFNYLKMHNNALEKSKLGISLVDPQKYAYPAMLFYNELGVTYHHLREYRKAIHYYNKSYQIAKCCENKEALYISKDNIIQIYKEKGEKNRAKKLLKNIVKDLGESLDKETIKNIFKEILEFAENKNEFFKEIKSLKRITAFLNESDILNFLANEEEKRGEQ